MTFLANDSLDKPIKLTCVSAHLICLTENVAPFKQFSHRCWVCFKSCAIIFSLKTFLSEKLNFGRRYASFFKTFIDSELTNIQHKLGCLPSLPNLFVICKIPNL